MPVVVLNGIVTRYSDYRDYDRILSIFTVEHGRIDAKARGCKRPTSALLAASQPFVYAEFELYQSGEKYTVNQAEVRESFFPIREDIERFSYGSAMLRLSQEAVQPEQPNDALFSLMYYALSYLAYGESDPQDLFICFLLRFLNIAGYCPSIVSCAGCGRDIRQDARIAFSARQGGAVCAACGGGSRAITKLSLELMRRMLILSDEGMDRVVLKENSRRELLTALTEYAECVLEYGARALHFVRQTIDDGEQEYKKVSEIRQNEHI